jgi:hypothetical protein
VIHSLKNRDQLVVSQIQQIHDWVVAAVDVKLKIGYEIQTDFESLLDLEFEVMIFYSDEKIFFFQQLLLITNNPPNISWSKISSPSKEQNAVRIKQQYSF